MYRKSIDVSPQTKSKDGEVENTCKGMSEVLDKEEFRSESIAALRARAQAHTARMMTDSDQASSASNDTPKEKLHSTNFDDMETDDGSDTPK